MPAGGRKLIFVGNYVDAGKTQILQQAPGRRERLRVTGAGAGFAVVVAGEAEGVEHGARVYAAWGGVGDASATARGSIRRGAGAFWSGGNAGKGGGAVGDCECGGTG